VNAAAKPVVFSIAILASFHVELSKGGLPSVKLIGDFVWLVV
jgi:hypothetical protein